MRRTQRLRSARDFRRVREAGRTWAHTVLVLSAAPNRYGRTRCGIVVRKSLGNAVQRNRLKRRVREAVRQIYAEIISGWDVIFIVRTPLITATYDQLCGAIRRLLTQANLLRLDDQDRP